MLDENYPKIGQAGPGHPVYELDVNDFLEVLDPPSGFDLKKIDPTAFFITSGDAIQKTKYLSNVLWRYAGDARRQLNALPKPSGEQIEFEADCWRQAGAARHMIAALQEAKGENVFLETEWRERRLCCLPKNPRSKTNEQDPSENVDVV